MGNVLASSAPPPVPPTFTPTNLQTEPSNIEPLPPQDSKNPGPMDDLHKKCKDVFPMVFEGAKFMVNKGLSSHFQITHSLTMSTTNPSQSGYKFGATYVGTKQVGPGEAYPILIGDVDPSGNVNANIVHLFNNNLLGKLMYRVQKSKVVAMQSSLDYRGSDFTASITTANMDFVNSAGVVVTHYLQALSKQVALGAELAYQFGPNVPGYHAAILNLAGRYSQDDFTFSGTIGGAGIHCCFYQKCSETLQIGAEIETNLRVQESVATVGYQVDIPKANFVFKGMLDSTWTVGAVIEKKLQPLPFTFSLSGSLNQKNHQFRLGVGFIIG